MIRFKVFYLFENYLYYDATLLGKVRGRQPKNSIYSTLPKSNSIRKGQNKAIKIFFYTSLYITTKKQY